MNVLLLFAFLASSASVLKDFIETEWKWENKNLISILFCASTLFPLLVNLFVFLTSDKNKMKVLKRATFRTLFMDLSDNIESSWCNKGNGFYCNNSSPGPSEHEGGVNITLYDETKSQEENSLKTLNIDDNRVVINHLECGVERECFDGLKMIYRVNMFSFVEYLEKKFGPMSEAEGLINDETGVELTFNKDLENCGDLKHLLKYIKWVEDNFKHEFEAIKLDDTGSKIKWRKREGRSIVEKEGRVDKMGIFVNIEGSTAKEFVITLPELDENFVIQIDKAEIEGRKFPELDESWEIDDEHHVSIFTLLFFLFLSTIKIIFRPLTKVINSIKYRRNRWSYNDSRFKNLGEILKDMREAFNIVLKKVILLFYNIYRVFIFLVRVLLYFLTVPFLWVKNSSGESISIDFDIKEFKSAFQGKAAIERYKCEEFSILNNDMDDSFGPYNKEGLRFAKFKPDVFYMREFFKIGVLNILVCGDKIRTLHKNKVIWEIKTSFCIRQIGLMLKLLNFWRDNKEKGVLDCSSDTKVRRGTVILHCFWIDEIVKGIEKGLTLRYINLKKRKYYVESEMVDEVRVKMIDSVLDNLIGPENRTIFLQILRLYYKGDKVGIFVDWAMRQRSCLTLVRNIRSADVRRKKDEISFPNNHQLKKLCSDMGYFLNLICYCQINDLDKKVLVSRNCVQLCRKHCRLWDVKPFVVDNKEVPMVCGSRNKSAVLILKEILDKTPMGRSGNSQKMISQGKTVWRKLPRVIPEQYGVVNIRYSLKQESIYKTIDIDERDKLTNGNKNIQRIDLNRMDRFLNKIKSLDESVRDSCKIENVKRWTNEMDEQINIEYKNALLKGINEVNDDFKRKKDFGSHENTRGRMLLESLKLKINKERMFKVQTKIEQKKEKEFIKEMESLKGKFQDFIPVERRNKFHAKRNSKTVFKKIDNIVSNKNSHLTKITSLIESNKFKNQFDCFVKNGLMDQKNQVETRLDEVCLETKDPLFQKEMEEIKERRRAKIEMIKRAEKVEEDKIKERLRGKEKEERIKEEKKKEEKIKREEEKEKEKEKKREKEKEKEKEREKEREKRKEKEKEKEKEEKEEEKRKEKEKEKEMEKEKQKQKEKGKEKEGEEKGIKSEEDGRGREGKEWVEERINEEGELKPYQNPKIFEGMSKGEKRQAIKQMKKEIKNLKIKEKEENKLSKEEMKKIWEGKIQREREKEIERAALYLDGNIYDF